MKINYTSSKLYNITSLLMILILALMFILNNINIKLLIKGSIWLFFIITYLILFPIQKGSSKLKHKDQFYLLSFISGFCYILIYFASGIILGFGKSPYAKGIVNISLNIYAYILPIIAKELIRGFLLINYAKKNNIKIAIITILMILVDISIIQVSKLSNLKEVIIYLSQILGPLICINIYASYACIVSDPICSIIFLIIFNVIEFISPVLPMLQWLSRGLINMSIPIFSFMSLSFFNDKVNKSYKSYKVKKENVFSLAAASVICVLLIWFTVGVFPIYPSVILTGSMKPLIDPGDIVIIKKIQKVEDIENLKIGDIIQFKRDEILIVHRIIDLVINNEDGLTYYKTKGDNNSSADKELVHPNNVKGTVYKTIPKLGILTLLLRNNNNIIFDNLEF